MNTASRLGAREYLVAGKPITELESIVLFGVASLTKLVSELRREGWVVQSQRVPYAAALRRVNEHAVLQPPANLPVREIYLTEWWIAR